MLSFFFFQNPWEPKIKFCFDSGFLLTILVKFPRLNYVGNYAYSFCNFRTEQNDNLSKMSMNKNGRISMTLSFKTWGGIFWKGHLHLIPLWKEKYAYTGLSEILGLLSVARRQSIIARCGEVQWLQVLTYVMQQQHRIAKSQPILKYFRCAFYT